MCPPGTGVLAAVSGGSDSVALAHVLTELAQAGGFRLVSLAHLNHCLRPTADRDEQVCRELALRLDLPITVSRIDVAGYAAEHRLSTEIAARRVRYAFLHRAAEDCGAGRIAVGHTRDDQAETVLLKLIRGAGMNGLAGIYPRKGALIRPLLDVSRADLREYLHGQQVVWVEDESNRDLENPRNRIRHQVLPELDRSYGAPAAPAIARAAAQVREDGQWLDELARERSAVLVSSTREGLEIDTNELTREPRPVRRRVVFQALLTIARGREVGLDHVEAVLGLVGGPGGGVDVPGGRVELRRGKLVLLQQGSPPKCDNRRSAPGRVSN